MEERSKRIAKNTLLLYVRTFITMVIGLYTGRVTLEALGVDDYGIYNVIGGIVGMSSLITTMLTGAGARHLTYTIGEGNQEAAATMFSTISVVQLVLGLGITVLLELGGIWFLKAGANIPDGSMEVAYWVLHFSIATLFVNIISSQYNSLIVAYERMDVFAYIGILDAVAKLGIVFAIVKFDDHRLVYFAALQLVVAILLRLICYLYCHRYFHEPKGKWDFQWGIVKHITNFAGWNFVQHSCWVFSTQGVSLIINSFFGVALNAARGVAMTVSGAFQGFVGSFTMAYNPQITKSYAAGDYEYCYNLANKGTKYTIYMMLLFIVPLCAEAKSVLQLWLTEIPAYSVIFLQFTLFEALAIQSGQTLLKVIEANGNIKRNSIETAFITGWIFPLTWVAYKLNLPVWSNYVVFIAAFLLVNCVRLRTLKILVDYPIRAFMKSVAWPVVMVMALSFVAPVAINWVWPQSLLRFFVCVPFYIFTTCLTIYFVGIDVYEREFLKTKIKDFQARYLRHL